MPRSNIEEPQALSTEQSAGIVSETLDHVTKELATEEPPNSNPDEELEHKESAKDEAEPYESHPDGHNEFKIDVKVDVKPAILELKSTISFQDAGQDQLDGDVGVPAAIEESNISPADVGP